MRHSSVSKLSTGKGYFLFYSPLVLQMGDTALDIANKKKFLKIVNMLKKTG